MKCSPLTLEKLANYLAVGAIAIITVITLASAANAATEADACEVYRMDIAAELIDRGYVFVPESCHAEAEGQAGFKFTVVVDGNKEVIHCNQQACQ